MDELISVIVPVYKVESYIRKSVDSILAQTYTNIEIILVDDGSPDSCGTICDEYKEKDTRVCVIHKENGGLSDARNAGIEKAKGGFVAFVDSDDYIHPRMLEILYNTQIKYDADLVVCKYKKVYDLEYDIHDINRWNTRVFSSHEALMHLCNGDSIHFTVAWNKLYKKRLFDSIRFPKGRNQEDVATCHLFLYSSDRIIYTDAELYFYNIRPGSIMTRYDYTKAYGLQALREKRAFFEEKGEYDLYMAASRGYIRNIIWYYARIAAFQKDKKSALLAMRKEYNENYAQCSKGAKGKEKLMLSMFRFAPDLYCTVWNMVNRDICKGKG